MRRTVPFVRIVVLAFDGAEMTAECLRSLVASNWPKERFEIVLVDNGSLDDVVERVTTELPEVRLLEPLENLGFAGGCNLGITARQCSSGRPLEAYDYVALVNNDATVSPNWLDELVPALEADERIGAVSPKMLLEGRYSEVEVSALVSDRGSSEPSLLRVTAVRIDDERSDESISFDEGFTPLGAETHRGDELGQATLLGGRIRIRRDSASEPARTRVSLRLSSDRSGRVRLRTDLGESECQVSAVEPESLGRGSWSECEIGPDSFDVINNAGSSLFVGGSAGDRGFLERDSGQFDESTEVFAWCGGAVLLRKEYLDDVGLFDDSFFLYYEDTDLSWRGRLKGWSYRYVPTAVVRHRHAQSSVVGSDLFRFQVERNRLLVLAKNAPSREALAAIFGSIRQISRTAVTDLVKPVLRLSPPRLQTVRLHFRILRSFTALLPRTLKERWSMRCRVSRKKVYSWAVTKTIARPEFEKMVRTSDDDNSTSSRDNSPSTHAGSDVTIGVYNLFWDTLGGGEVVSGEIARLLCSTGTVTLLGPRRPDAESFAGRLGVDISSCSWREVNDDDEASRASADYDIFVNCTYSSRALNRAPIGLYYVHFPRALVSDRTALAFRSGIRIVRLARHLPVRTSKFDTAERLFNERLVDDSWVSSYTNFLANSTYTQTWIRRIWHVESEIVYPPVRSRDSSSTKKEIIASVGRFFDPSLGHSKKQMEMLTAFADMARSHEGVHHWRLALVGGADSVSRNYVLRIRRAAQGLPIDVLVNAPRDVVDQTLSDASIYWHAGGYGEDETHHPERFEHFGISVVEAMAAGAVPLVFGAAGPAEIVRDGVDGFHWHSLEQLAQETRRLMGNPELLRTMSESAKVRAREYDIAAFERRLQALVESLRTAGHAR